MDKFTWDSELTGFGERERNNRITYVVQYRVGHKQRRMKIGDAGKVTRRQAEEKAKKILAAAQLGGDPAEDRRRGRKEARLTVGVVREDYLTDVRSGLRDRSFTEVSRYLRTHWKPLHSTAISAITRKDVAAEVTRMKNKNGAVAADRALSALSGMFGWCVGNGLIETNPCIGVIRPQGNKPRDRVLGDSELAAIWRGLPDNVYGAIVKLLILIPFRREEAGGLRRSEINIETRTINLPAARCKNHRPLSLPLSDLAWQIVVPWLDQDGEFLFGQRGFNGWSKHKAALDLRLGESVGPWVHHDLRRSVATHLGDLGFAQPHVVECILNHAGGFRAGVRGTYNRAAYANEVRAALLSWSSHVESLVEGKSAKVVPLRA
jgi:integrase